MKETETWTIDPVPYSEVISWNEGQEKLNATNEEIIDYINKGQLRVYSVRTPRPDGLLHPYMQTNHFAEYDCNHPDDFLDKAGHDSFFIYIPSWGKLLDHTEDVGLYKTDIRALVEEPAKELISLVENVAPEVELFYDQVEKNLKNWDFLGDAVGRAQWNEWKAAIEEVFEEKEKWVSIKPVYFEDHRFSKLGPGKQKRDFIGILLSCIVKEKYPEKRQWWGNSQRLYKLLKKIQKEESLSAIIKEFK